jgi:DNA-binding MarR family transcriptional regulator
MSRAKSDVAATDVLECVYFAHMEFADAADRILEKLQLGRAHHRLMYFLDKSPGLEVRELLSLLSISNQALARTMRQLIDLGYLQQMQSSDDRRVRKNYLTDTGKRLIRMLTAEQHRLIESRIKAFAAEDLSTFHDVASALGGDRIASWRARSAEAVAEPR